MIITLVFIGMIIVGTILLKIKESKRRELSYSVRDMIEQSAANSYGSILFILKNREGRFNFTRTHENVGEEVLLDDKLEEFLENYLRFDNN